MVVYCPFCRKEVKLSGKHEVVFYLVVDEVEQPGVGQTCGSCGGVFVISQIDYEVEC